MADFRDFQGMIPYHILFPKSNAGGIGLVLPDKVGKAKAGEYEFIETYCVEKNCDCRRTTLLVLNAKGKTMAVIDFGFDPDRPLAGPLLNDFAKQSAAAGNFLEIFVDAVNDNPAWLKAMYANYRKVRRKVDGHAYRGRPFPKPGKFRRQATSPEAAEEETAALFEEMGPASVAPPPTSPLGKALKTHQPGLFSETPAAPTLPDLLDRYRRIVGDQGIAMPHGLRNDLTRYVLGQPRAGDELAVQLVRLFALPEADEEPQDAALRLLGDVLEILRTRLDGQHPDARERMISWQEALARHVFNEGVDDLLCAAVTRTLLDARVEILPQVHEAGSRRLDARGAEELSRSRFLAEVGPAEMFRTFEEMGIDSPFELLEALLEMMAVGDPEVQIALGTAMYSAASPLIRDTAALMLFHPQAQVRAGMAAALCTVEGGCFSPATLRRLIVARNWFPEEIRTCIDQAINNARRARVECASIQPGMTMTVYASVVDGAGAQSLQIIIPDGKGFVCCSILLKMRVGVADAFLIPLENKRALRDFLKIMTEEIAMLESTPEYLDLRLGQALAEGVGLGRVPNPWLVAIAERLGREPWRPTPFDPRRDLAALRTELEIAGAGFLTDLRVRAALKNSGAWPELEPFAGSWFEDGPEVARDVAAVTLNKKTAASPRIIARFLDGVLAERRETWLARLVLTTFWLKSAPRPPVHWSEMFHVAAALADDAMPLKQIPLMVAIAEMTFGAYLSREAERI
ncbi:MAG: hypothetical protein RQ753_01595 [Desulfurivibrionaceae bacterium]|nr:hypothetical protein [Desulfurivibrionaceae bacterium]